MSSRPIGSPMTTGSDVPMRSRTSLKISDSLKARLTWLATWNSRLFWPPKKTGTTPALDRWMSCAVNGCHGVGSVGEIDRQQIVPRLRCVEQHRIGQDHEFAAHLLDQPADHQPVEH